MAIINAKVKKVGEALSSVWPKAAIHLLDEDNNYLLNQGEPLPVDEDFVIVEPLLAGWGTDYDKLYAKGYLIKYGTGEGNTPIEPPIDTESGHFKTLTGSAFDFNYRYDADMPDTDTEVSSIPEVINLYVGALT